MVGRQRDIERAGIADQNEKLPDRLSNLISQLSCAGVRTASALTAETDWLLEESGFELLVPP
jgi:hypothetical protein